MSDIHIRPANVDDSPALARILTETNKETLQGLVPDRCLSSPTLEQSERNWRRFFQSGRMAEGEIMLVARHVGSRPFNWVGYETREILYGWENLALLAQQE